MQFNRALSNTSTASRMGAYSKSRRQRRHHLSPQVLWLGLSVSLLLLLLFTANHHTLADTDSGSDHGEFAYYRNATASVSLLRFRDFEPRSISSELQPKSARDSNLQPSGAARKARGLHFQADDKDLTIDLEFIIPFLRIPIQRSMQITTSAFRRLINLNSGALLLSGVIVVAGVLVAGLLKLLSGPALIAYQKNTRASDRLVNVMDAFNAIGGGPHDDQSQSATQVGDLLAMVEAKLRQNDIDVSACAQKAICNYVRRATAGAGSGARSPLARIVDGFISLDLLRSYLNGSALQEAIDMGRANGTLSCEQFYDSCEWPQPANKMLKLLIDYLSVYGSKFA